MGVLCHVQTTKLTHAWSGWGWSAGPQPGLSASPMPGPKRKQYATQGLPPLIDWSRTRNMARQIIKEEAPAADWHRQWEQYYANIVGHAATR